jgi:hypothetical protein
MQPTLLSTKPDAYADWIGEKLRQIAILMGETVTPERINLTVDELLQTPRRDLEKALAAARKECRFFPRPVEIFELIERENAKPRIPIAVLPKNWQQLDIDPSRLWDEEYVAQFVDMGDDHWERKN